MIMSIMFASFLFAWTIFCSNNSWFNSMNFCSQQKFKWWLENYSTYQHWAYRRALLRQWEEVLMSETNYTLLGDNCVTGNEVRWEDNRCSEFASRFQNFQSGKTNFWTLAICIWSYAEIRAWKIQRMVEKKNQLWKWWLPTEILVVTASCGTCGILDSETWEQWWKSGTELITLEWQTYILFLKTEKYF